MKPDQYENNAEGILCVYKNPKWLVCIKNWKPDNDIAGILQLGVAEEKRGQGLGSAILHASLRWAKLKGARHAWVQVEAHNAAARALYARAGFRDVYEYSYRGPEAA